MRAWCGRTMGEEAGSLSEKRSLALYDPLQLSVTPMTQRHDSVTVRIQTEPRFGSSLRSSLIVLCVMIATKMSPQIVSYA